MVFKKGDAPGPGRPRMDPEVRKIKDANNAMLVFDLHRYCSMTRDQLRLEMMDPKKSMFELICGNIVVKAANGDRDSRLVLFDRLIGKLKEETPLVASEERKLDKLDNEQVANLLKASHG